MLDERQAFQAMRIFLEEYWNMSGRGDELRLLLSSLDGSSREGGLPVDIAMWDDWQRICKRVLEEQPELR
jgi:hypothetical protein